MNKVTDILIDIASILLASATIGVITTSVLSPKEKIAFTTVVIFATLITAILREAYKEELL